MAEEVALKQVEQEEELSRKQLKMKSYKKENSTLVNGGHGDDAQTDGGSDLKGEIISDHNESHENPSLLSESENNPQDNHEDEKVDDAVSEERCGGISAINAESQLEVVEAEPVKVSVTKDATTVVLQHCTQAFKEESKGMKFIETQEDYVIQKNIKSDIAEEVVNKTTEIKAKTKTEAMNAAEATTAGVDTKTVSTSSHLAVEQEKRMPKSRSPSLKVSEEIKRICFDYFEDIQITF